MFRSRPCSLVLRNAAVDFGGKPQQRISYVNWTCCSRIEVAQGLKQAFEIVRGPRPDLGQSGRWSDTPPILHHQLDQRFPGLRVGFERQDVAVHPAVRTIAAPNLLAARPSRLANRALA